MEYNIKLSKGKININGKEYDIPHEVAEFIIYETSTRDDIIQTRDVYERTIEKAIDYVSNKKAIINTDVIRIFDLFEIDEQGYTNELLDILKEVR